MSQKPTSVSWIETGLAEYKRRHKIGSNRKVAEKIKVSPTSISAWLSGQRIPTRRVEKLAEAFFPDDPTRRQAFTLALSEGAQRALSPRPDPSEALTTGAQALDLRYLAAPPICAPATEDGGFLDGILRRFTVFANLKTPEPRAVVRPRDFFRMISRGQIEGHIVGPVLCAPGRLPKLFFVNTTIRLGVTAVVLSDHPDRAEIADALRLSPHDSKRAGAFRRRIKAVVMEGDIGHEYLRALGFENDQLHLETGDEPEAFASSLREAGSGPVAIVVDELFAGKIIRASKRADLDLLFEPDETPPGVPYMLGLVTLRSWDRFWAYLDFAFESFVELDKSYICERMVMLHEQLRIDCERTLAHARPTTAPEERAKHAAQAMAWASRVIGLGSRGPRTALFLRSPAWDEVLRETRRHLGFEPTEVSRPANE